MPYSQVVRHKNLTLAFVGSNPTRVAVPVMELSYFFHEYTFIGIGNHRKVLVYTTACILWVQFPPMVFVVNKQSK